MRTTGLSAEDAAVVAFRGEADWAGGETLQVNDRLWQVHRCQTPIEVREALAYRAPDGPPLLILTPLSHADLGADVMARLYKRRLFEFDRWAPVLRAFGAHRLDARLAAYPWLAEVLLSGQPAEGYARVATGTLDAATAWREAARVVLGVEADGLDATRVLGWTVDGSFAARWMAQPPEARQGLRHWLASAAGPAASLVLTLVERGHGADALPIALACDVLFAGRDASSGRAHAAIRLERYTGGERVDASVGRVLAAAALDLMHRAAEPRQAAAWLARADDLLRELGAEQEAHRGRVSPLGFAQRLDRYAAALDEALDASDAATALARAAESLDAVRGHDRGRADHDLLARAEHALRLVRYCHTTATASPPASFGDAVAAYACDHAYADEARVPLYASETHQAFGAVLARIAEMARDRREAFTRAFARLAAAWFEAPTPSPHLLPVEHVVRDVLAPLAAQVPVLLLVVDGMNLPVAHTLVTSIAQRGWMSMTSATGAGGGPAIAALPSVTEVCRTSLLCGTLRVGTAADERRGFASHPDLLAHSKPKHPPVLFHKADLGAGAVLSPEVAAALAHPEQRVVGAVVNAVDDHLLKDDMVRPVWTTHYVPAIAALCDAARAARRAIVVTADHGHVLDLKLTDRAVAGDADRHRQATRPPGDGEVLVTGPRVLASAPAIVVAASESVRYASRKNGYHGGVSPQELVVPLSVLVADAQPLEGWTEAAERRPAWWDLDLPLTSMGVAPAPATEGPALPLFEAARQQVAVMAVAEGAAPEWLPRLLASEALRDQRARATRAGLGDDRLGLLLSALAARGGRLTVAACASRLGVPAGRVSSIVAAASQLLNFDGYQVIYLTGDEVVLDEPLLRGQFEL